MKLTNRVKEHNNGKVIHIVCTIILIAIFTLDYYILKPSFRERFDIFSTDYMLIDIVVSNTVILLIFIITFWIIDSKRIREEVAKNNNALILLWISYQRLAGMNENNPSNEFESLLDFTNRSNDFDKRALLETSIDILFPFHKEIIEFGLNGSLSEKHYASYLIFYNEFREIVFSINKSSIPNENKLRSIEELCNKEIQSLANEPVIKQMLLRN